MKKQYALLFMLIFFQQISNAQISIADTSLAWFTTHDIAPLGNAQHWANKIYYTGRDTIIDNKVNFIFESINSNSGIKTAYNVLKENNNYYYENNLLYNFDAQVGDTLYTNSYGTHYYYIEDIDSVLVHNNYRKYIHCTTDSIPMPYGYMTNIDWIEGIGAVHYGVLSIHTPDMGFGMSFCGVEKSGKKIYPDTIGICGSKF